MARIYDGPRTPESYEVGPENSYYNTLSFLYARISQNKDSMSMEQYKSDEMAYRQVLVNAWNEMDAKSRALTTAPTASQDALIQKSAQAAVTGDKGAITDAAAVAVGTGVSLIPVVGPILGPLLGGLTKALCGTKKSEKKRIQAANAAKLADTTAKYMRCRVGFNLDLDKSHATYGFCVNPSTGEVELPDIDIDAALLDPTIPEDVKKILRDMKEAGKRDDMKNIGYGLATAAALGVTGAIAYKVVKKKRNKK